MILMRSEDLKKYVQAARKELFAYRGVRTVGVGYVMEHGRKTKELGIIVGVEEKLPTVMLNPDNIVPASLKGTGIRIDVIKSGSPVPLSQPSAPSCGEIAKVSVM